MRPSAEPRNRCCLTRPRYPFCTLTVERRLRGGELRNLYFGFGSASAGRASNLNAGKPPSKLSDQTADVRGRQWTTLKRHYLSTSTRLKAAVEPTRGPLGRIRVRRASSEKCRRPSTVWAVPADQSEGAQGSSAACIDS